MRAAPSRPLRLRPWTSSPGSAVDGAVDGGCGGGDEVPDHLDVIVRHSREDRAEHAPQGREERDGEFFGRRPHDDVHSAAVTRIAAPLDVPGARGSTSDVVAGELRCTAAPSSPGPRPGRTAPSWVRRRRRAAAAQRRRASRPAAPPDPDLSRTLGGLGPPGGLHHSRSRNSRRGPGPPGRIATDRPDDRSGGAFAEPPIDLDPQVLTISPTTRPRRHTAHFGAARGIMRSSGPRCGYWGLCGVAGRR
jgi:hypothetical protein